MPKCLTFVKYLNSQKNITIIYLIAIILLAMFDINTFNGNRKFSVYNDNNSGQEIKRIISETNAYIRIWLTIVIIRVIKISTGTNTNRVNK